MNKQTTNNPSADNHFKKAEEISGNLSINNTSCILKDTKRSLLMYEVRTTQEFDDWLDNLRNRTAVLRIAARIDRIEQGNFGDTKSITNEISELRFFFGSGYRIYYTVKEKTIVLLLNGGDKSSQKKDIKKAKDILDQISGESDEE